MRAFRVGDAALPRRAPYSGPHLYFLPQAAKFPPVLEMRATLCTMLDIILTYWDQVIMTDTKKRRVRTG
jgi:hypothetical protein